MLDTLKIKNFFGSMNTQNVNSQKGGGRKKYFHPLGQQQQPLPHGKFGIS